VFEHSGKFYSIAESHMPQEIDILSLKTLKNWDLNADWNRPFTSHPKVFVYYYNICSDILRWSPDQEITFFLSLSQKILYHLI
jgi:hypothetical protein